MNANIRSDLPKPVYAVAGAGDLAYQRLRQLPEAAGRGLRTAGQTAEELRGRLRQRETDGDLTSRVRASAERGTAVLLSRAATARERAVAGYRDLVARGEQVVAQRTAADEHGRTGDVEVEVGPVQRGRPEDTSGPDRRDDA